MSDERQRRDQDDTEGHMPRSYGPRDSAKEAASEQPKDTEGHMPRSYGASDSAQEAPPKEDKDTEGQSRS